MAKLITPGRFLSIQTLINPFKTLLALPAVMLHNHDYGIFFTDLLSNKCKLFFKLLSVTLTLFAYLINELSDSNSAFVSNQIFLKYSPFCHAQSVFHCIGFQKMYG